ALFDGASSNRYAPALADNDLKILYDRWLEAKNAGGADAAQRLKELQDAVKLLQTQGYAGLEQSAMRGVATWRLSARFSAFVRATADFLEEAPPEIKNDPAAQEFLTLARAALSADLTELSDRTNPGLVSLASRAMILMERFPSLSEKLRSERAIQRYQRELGEIQAAETTDAGAARTVLSQQITLQLRSLGILGPTAEFRLEQVSQHSAHARMLDMAGEAYAQMRQSQNPTERASAEAWWRQVRDGLLSDILGIRPDQLYVPPAAARLQAIAALPVEQRAEALRDVLRGPDFVDSRIINPAYLQRVATLAARRGPMAAPNRMLLDAWRNEHAPQLVAMLPEYIHYIHQIVTNPHATPAQRDAAARMQAVVQDIVTALKLDGTHAGKMFEGLAEQAREAKRVCDSGGPCSEQQRKLKALLEAGKLEPAYLLSLSPEPGDAASAWSALERINDYFRRQGAAPDQLPFTLADEATIWLAASNPEMITSLADRHTQSVRDRLVFAMRQQNHDWVALHMDQLDAFLRRPPAGVPPGALTRLRAMRQAYADYESAEAALEALPEAQRNASLKVFNSLQSLSGEIMSARYLPEITINLPALPGSVNRSSADSLRHFFDGTHVRGLLSEDQLVDLRSGPWPATLRDPNLARFVLDPNIKVLRRYNPGSGGSFDETFNPLDGGTIRPSGLNPGILLQTRDNLVQFTTFERDYRLRREIMVDEGYRMLVDPTTGKRYYLDAATGVLYQRSDRQGQANTPLKDLLDAVPAASGLGGRLRPVYQHTLFHYPDSNPDNPRGAFLVSRSLYYSTDDAGRLTAAAGRVEGQERAVVTEATGAFHRVSVSNLNLHRLETIFRQNYDDGGVTRVRSFSTDYLARGSDGTTVVPVVMVDHGNDTQDSFNLNAGGTNYSWDMHQTRYVKRDGKWVWQSRFYLRREDGEA
ncbi:MAG TPA: hypothetical protein VNI01_04805, partial [Elusimicrobiota bacterium]|nr:hypothetical protein [Elusimicrobiota bacterium]